MSAPACCQLLLHLASTSPHNAAGYSKVRLAIHRETGKQYACKVMTLPRPGSDQQPDRASIMKVRCAVGAAVFAGVALCACL